MGLTARALPATAILLMVMRAEGAERPLNLCDIASCSGQTTTVSEWTDATHPVLAAAVDFRDGQDILIAGAGPAFAGAAPAGPAAHAVGSGGGSRYTYAVAACDGLGGHSAAAVSAASRGAERLTVNDYQRIFWTGAEHCFLLWKKTGEGPFTFLGSTAATQFDDEGQIAEARPFWVPAEPPSAPQPDWLVTTVAQGGGTTAPALAEAAAHRPTGPAAVALHDDTGAVAAWVGRLNRAGGAGYIPAAARVRTSHAAPAIAADHVSVAADPGALLLPAGATDERVQAALSIDGGGTGPMTALAAALREGTAEAEVADASGFVAGGYVLIRQRAPSFGNAGVYSLISPVEAVSGNRLSLALPAPVSFAAQLEQASVGAAPIKAGDVLELRVEGCVAAVARYTARPEDLASGSNAGEAQDLVAAINGDAAMRTAGIQAERRGRTAMIYAPARPPCRWGGSAGLMLSAGAAAELYPLKMTTGNAVRGVSCDLANVAGSRSAHGYHCVYAQYVAEARFADISCANAYGGSALEVYGSFAAEAETLSARRCGDVGFADIYFVLPTKAQILNLRSMEANAFGPVLAGGAYVGGSHWSADAAQLARCIKIMSTAVSAFYGLAASNCGSIGVGFASADYKLDVFGLDASGDVGVRTNSENVWFSSSLGGPAGDDNNNFIRVYGLRSRNSGQYDIDTGPGDTDNEFYGATVGVGRDGRPNILNAGNAVFYGLNGAMVTGGQSGPGQTPSVQVALGPDGVPTFPGGSWTPSLAGATAAGAPTYARRSGSWEAVGRQVTLRFALAATALGGAQGAVQLGGLPVASAEAAGDYGVCEIAFYRGLRLAPGATTISALIAPNSRLATLYQSGGAAGSQEIPAASFGPSAELVGTCHYRR